MQNDIKKFGIRLVILSIIVFSISAIVFTQFLKEYYLQIFPYVLIFFVAITFINFVIIQKSSKHRISRFANSFMLSITLKLIIYSIFIAAYLFFNRENAIPFVIVFMCLYLIYTVFEISLTLSLVNRNK